MKLEKSSWIAAIVGTIVAIVGLIVAIFTWLVDRNDAIRFCKDLGKTIAAPFNWLAHPITLPFFGLILAALVIAIIFYCWGQLVTEQQPQQQEPFSASTNYQDYRADDIFGVHWKWMYVYGKLDVNNLTAYCPKKDCMRRLEPQLNRNARANVNQMGFPISLLCPRCGYQQDFNTDMATLERNVLLEIERLINTNEFQIRLTQNKT